MSRHLGACCWASLSLLLAAGGGYLLAVLTRFAPEANSQPRTPKARARQLDRAPPLDRALPLGPSSRFFHRTRLERKVREPNAAHQGELLLEAEDANSTSWTCAVLPSTVCERCAQASGPSSRAGRRLASGLARRTSAAPGRCKTSYRWSWQKPLEANDAGNAVPGLRAVRGVDALREPGVEVVAQWRQSNWPALVRRRAGPVRAVSEADKARLCALWKGEHSYQGWSVMLGCAAAGGKCRLTCLRTPPRLPAWWLSTARLAPTGHPASRRRSRRPQKLAPDRTKVEGARLSTARPGPSPRRVGAALPQRGRAGAAALRLRRLRAGRDA